ncbi:unnamed protein product [Scytosiphon promiscuus]
MMATGRTALSIATCTALVLGRGHGSTPASGSTSNGRESRRLASCDTVQVTGGYDYTPGNYVEEGSRNGVALYVSEDRSAELFYSEREDDRRVRKTRRLLPQDLLDDAADGGEELADGHGVGVQRSLGACNSGFWSLAPSGGGYPHLTVADCAEHPADIRVTTWSQVSCAECDEEAFNGSTPAVVCPGDDSSSTSSTSAEQTDGDGGYGTDDDTASSGQVGGGVVDDDDASGGGVGDGAGVGEEATAPPTPVASPEVVVDESCKVLDVGGSYPGLYTKAGEYGGKGDFYSEDLQHNIFFEDNSAIAGGTGGDDGDDDSDDDSSDSDDDDRRRRRMLRALFGGQSGKGESTRRLAACAGGYWIKTPTGGGYPFYAVADCAPNPEDIAATSPWMKVGCDGCTATAVTSDEAIACATGEDAFVATPSPVPPVQVGADVGETLPGAGPTTCENITLTGPRAGEYTVQGSVNGAADVYSNDGLWRMFVAAPAPGLSRRDLRHLSSAADEAGETWGGKLGLSSGRAVRRESRGLQSCSSYWYLTPAEDRYPAYAVLDCAEHPADIVSTDWLFLDCEDCEVVTASPKPAVSCTGAPDNLKRGGSLTTPSPVAVDSAATLAPGTSDISESRRATTCTDLYLTGDFPGNYTANGTYRGKLDFFNDDNTVNLYFELAESRRRSLLSEAFQEGTGTDRSLLPGEAMVSALEEAYGAGSGRRLAICSSGYWILAPVGGDGYPVLGVPDCAEHPADIRANTWLVMTCDTCGVQEAPTFVAPTITCADSVSGGAAGSVTPSPGIPETCGTTYVTGPTAGIYYQNGNYGGRGDYFSGNGAWNMYWTFYAGKPVNRNRFRRGLSIPDERRGGDARWSEEYELAIETLAADLRRNAPPAVAVDGDGRRLEACDDGFWLITPRGGGFPFYGTLNCADHPAEIANLATWSVVECDGCGSNPVEGTVTISCDGTDFTPPPSTAGSGGGGNSAVGITGTPSPAGGASPSSSGGKRAADVGGSACRNTFVSIASLVLVALGVAAQSL